MVMREEPPPAQSNDLSTERSYGQLRIEDIKKSPGYMDDSIANSSAHQPPLHDPSEGNLSGFLNQLFLHSFKVIGIDEDNDDQPLDNLNFDTTPRSSGTFKPPTPLEIPVESIQKSHETESIKNATKSIPVLVPPPVVDPNRKSDLPQMPKLVPCPSPRRPTSAGSSRKSPSRKRKSSPAQTELPVNSSILQPPVLQPPKLTAITPLKTAMSSSDNEQPQKEPPITGTDHNEIILESKCYLRQK
jgi:hypothetical protein